MKKKRKEKQNITVWLERRTLPVFDAMAKKSKRSRNYVIARILESIAYMDKSERHEVLRILECTELVDG